MNKRIHLIAESSANETIEKLKKVFGVTKTADVFRRSLAFAQVVAKQADPSGEVVIRGANSPEGIAINLHT